MKIRLAVTFLLALLMAGCVGALPGAAKTSARTPALAGLTVAGVFDASWPYPGSVRQAGIRIHATRPGGVAGCGLAVDSARTDSAGRFQLVVPDDTTDWRLCTPSRSDGAADYPMFRLGGATADSVRVYCRGHGPSGAPQCLEVPPGAPMRWPGPPE